MMSTRDNASKTSECNKHQVPAFLGETKLQDQSRVYIPYILDMCVEAVTRHLRLDGNQPRPGYMVHRRSNAIRCAQPSETDDSSEMMAAGKLAPGPPGPPTVLVSSLLEII